MEWAGVGKGAHTASFLLYCSGKCVCVCVCAVVSD